MESGVAACAGALSRSVSCWDTWKARERSLVKSRSDLMIASRQAADNVLSEYGVVRSCKAAESLGIPEISIVVAEGAKRMQGWRFHSAADGTGVSVNYETARLTAIAESVERYCAMAPPRMGSLLQHKYADVHRLAIDPASFAWMSSRQYRRFPRLNPLTQEKTIDWCWGYSLNQRRKTLIPAALVYWALGGTSRSDFLPEMGSSGFACHVSWTHAVMSGLCEALERDALAIAWHARLPLTPLDPVGTTAGSVVGFLRATGLSYLLFQVPSDGPFPVIMAVAKSDDPEPFAVVGAACRPDPVAAATKAIFETCQGLCWLRDKRPGEPSRIAQLDDHAAFYAWPKGARLLLRRFRLFRRRCARSFFNEDWRRVSLFATGVCSYISA